MSVHQCPLCELRFISSAEVEWHLREDHDRGLGTRFAETAARTTRSPPPADGS